MSNRRDFLARAAAAGLVAAANHTGLVAARTSGRDSELPMKRYKIANTGLEVSRIAYGCGDLGGNDEHLSSDTIEKAVILISIACDHGITLFDHSDVYKDGRSETTFGEVLKRVPGLRNRVVIQSKCGLSTTPDPLLTDSPAVDLSRAHILRAVEGSLKRLDVDHLDILLLHWPDALAEPEEIAGAFDDLARAGKVRYFGLSNHTVGQIELLRKFVHQPLITNQIHIGLNYCLPIADGPEYPNGEHVLTNGILDYCRLHDIRVQAWSPLRGDLLNPPASASPQIKEVAELLSQLAARKITTPSAIALAWLLRHPAGIIPVIGATNPAHIAENCAADKLELSRQEWYALYFAAMKLQSRHTI